MWRCLDQVGEQGLGVVEYMWVVFSVVGALFGRSLGGQRHSGVLVGLLASGYGIMLRVAYHRLGQPNLFGHLDSFFSIFIPFQLLTPWFIGDCSPRPAC